MKIDKDHLIIAVDGEFSSGAGLIARELATHLGIACHDGDITDRAAALCGMDAGQARRQNDPTAGFPPSPDLAEAQLRVCRELAQSGPCVLVDRLAARALAGTPSLFRIFIHADAHTRRELFLRETGLSGKSAAAAFDRADAAYRSYYRESDPSWGHPGNYGLTLNASDAGLLSQAAAILRFLESMSGRDLEDRPAAR